MTTTLKFSLALVIPALLTACASTQTASTPSNSTMASDITLEFNAIAPKLVSGKPQLAEVTCQDTYMLGNPAKATKLADLRFYVTNLQVTTKDGKTLPVSLKQNDFQQIDLGLIDLENGTGSCSDRGDSLYNNQLTGTIPAPYTEADIQGVSFDIGVPSDRNHTLANDPRTKAPLDIQGMAWSWQMGRKFSKIELAPLDKVAMKDGTMAKIYNLHLGKMGCKGDATNGEAVNCKYNNIATVDLKTSTPLSQNNITLNLANLYANSDITTDKGKKAGCMSFKADGDCKALFEQMGLDYQTGTSTGKQKVFSLSTK